MNPLHDEVTKNKLKSKNMNSETIPQQSKNGLIKVDKPIDHYSPPVQI